MPSPCAFACVGAALTVSYPFVKRFFALPQLYLALAFSWGVPMAFAALTGALPRVAWMMFVATIIWVTIYDTLYAMVDREDDLKIGVNSSAIVFADMDRLIVGDTAADDARRAAPHRQEPAFRKRIPRRARRRGAVLRLPAVAHPRARAGRVPACIFKTTTMSVCRSLSASCSITSTARARPGVCAAPTDLPGARTSDRP